MKHICLLASLTLLIFSCGKNDKSPAAGTSASGSKTGLTVSSVEGYIVKASADSSITASGAIVPAEETELHPEARHGSNNFGNSSGRYGLYDWHAFFTPQRQSEFFKSILNTVNT